MDNQQVAEIRAFNRFYTRQIGLLDEHMLKSRFSLSEGRVLYEIGSRGRTAASELSRDLGLDRAYLHRMLQHFATEGLVTSTPDEADRRRSWLTLTAVGRKARDSLNRAWDKAVSEMIAPIDPMRRERLVESMTTIAGVLAPQADTLALREHRVGDLGWLIHRNGLLYNQQFGWDIGFEALVAGIYQEFQDLPDAPPKRLWIAERGTHILGSVFVIPFERSAQVAQLRMLYVEPEARGQGLGARLVDEAVAFSRASGYARMRLWTQETLVSARRIYAAAGFKCVDSEPHESFGKQLVSEFWELDL
jgi:DNA-binding MarR family transcriptional regulator/GNAT superfamily N-acetyltransferase